jgi:septin family protein
LLQAIQKLIDQKVDEKMKHYEQKYNEALAKLSSSTPSTKKLPAVGIKNGSVKPDPEEHTPSSRPPPTGIKKIVPKTNIGNSKGRSDSKESNHSKAGEENKRENSKKPIKDDAAEKKKEEARLKKEELERKKKEDLEKKKEEIEKKKKEKEEVKVPVK